MKIEQMTLVLAERLGYLKAINFIIYSSGLSYEAMEELVRRMNEDMDSKFKTP